jgi:hypothetical protein
VTVSFSRRILLHGVTVANETKAKMILYSRPMHGVKSGITLREL